MSSNKIVIPHPVEKKQILEGDILQHLSASTAAAAAAASSTARTDNGNCKSKNENQNKKQCITPSRGRNVSGRPWKMRPQKRASTLVKTAVNNQSKTWERKQAERVARQEARELQNQMVEEKRQAALLKKERRLENEKRRAENQYKAIQKSVQTLNYDKASRTMAAMSKKQLRQIKKTRVNTKTGVVEFVPAYAK